MSHTPWKCQGRWRAGRRYCPASGGERHNLAKLAMGSDCYACFATAANSDIVRSNFESIHSVASVSNFSVASPIPSPTQAVPSDATRSGRAAKKGRKKWVSVIL